MSNINSLIFKAPINSLSFGNVSFNLIREMYRRNMNVAIFPIGNDISFESFGSQIGDDFKVWLDTSINQRHKISKADWPMLQLWHLQNSWETIGSSKAPKVLYTFHEINGATDTEKNAVSMQDAVIFSSKFSEGVFRDAGCDNVYSAGVGFDSDSFYTDNSKRLTSDKITFSLIGKFEQRKNTKRIIETWIKRFGGDMRYMLNLCIYNTFFSQEDNAALLNDALGGKRIPNINVLPRLKTNEEIRQLHCASDISLSGLSNAEGWGLPAFDHTCLGKHSLVSMNTAHKDWASDENSITLESGSEVFAEDGAFFRRGGDFNQGTWVTFPDEDEVIHKMEIASEVCKSRNLGGLQLANNFTYKKMLDNILSVIENLQS